MKYEPDWDRVFAYECCRTNQPTLSVFDQDLFSEVTVKPISKSNLIPGEIQPLECYANAMEAICRNYDQQPKPRFCIGVQHQAGDTGKKVEHCWVEFNDEYFEPNPVETEGSVYHLYQSYSVEEMLAIMDMIGSKIIPNIEVLKGYRVIQ